MIRMITTNKVAAAGTTVIGTLIRRQFATTTSCTGTTELTLSLSGSGHLLVYQLGACRVLLQQQLQTRTDGTTKDSFTLPKITNVVGASGGAIAATVVALSSLQSSSSSFSLIEDYAQAFITQRGQGIQLLQDFWKKLEEESSASSRNTSVDTIGLHIATTRCEDGASKLFSFPHHHITATTQRNKILDCIRASCCIPPSFHPLDLVSSSSPYPEQEGFPIHDDVVGIQFYVDGGIATPAPMLVPPEMDNDDGKNNSTVPRTILVTPITGTSDHTLRISPGGTTSYWYTPQIHFHHDMGCYMSIANIKALQMASGMNVSSSELHSWYQRGQDDAHLFWQNNSSSFLDGC
jgi:predicted acylesterase/phospholipase RssA